MKFLCVPCDSPMKLQSVGPPERGSLSVVYSCPECGYEMAMLTNAYQTQVVQSLGVRIGPSTGLGAGPATDGAASGTSASGCPFSAMMPETGVGEDDARPGPTGPGYPMDSRRRGAARQHPRVRPAHGENRHREIRQGATERLKSTRRSSMPHESSSGCEGPEPRAPSPASARRDEYPPFHPALRHLLEPHLPL